MSGNARFPRGPILVKVIHREPDPQGLVKVSINCGGDPETSGYKMAYRGTLEQAMACLECCTRELWRLKTSTGEPPITPEGR